MLLSGIAIQLITIAESKWFHQDPIMDSIEIHPKHFPDITQAQPTKHRQKTHKILKQTNVLYTWTKTVQETKVQHATKQ